jgi:hypothetical protein
MFKYYILIVGTDARGSRKGALRCLNLSAGSTTVMKWDLEGQGKWIYDIEISGSAGWASVADQYKEITKEEALELTRRADSVRTKKRRRPKHMYGKLHYETRDFRDTLNTLFGQFIDSHHGELSSQMNNDLCGLRNGIMALQRSWVGSKNVEDRTGIKIPLHTTPLSMQAYSQRQSSSFRRVYPPCQVCGETRITNYCHVLPQSDGGPEHPDNYIYLCPTHHHLFDHNRLSKEEWDKIDFSGKIPAAKEYTERVRVPRLQKFWEKQRVKP